MLRLICNYEAMWSLRCTAFPLKSKLFRLEAAFIYLRHLLKANASLRIGWLLVFFFAIQVHFAKTRFVAFSLTLNLKSRVQLNSHITHEFSMAPFAHIALHNHFLFEVFMQVLQSIEDFSCLSGCSTSHGMEKFHDKMAFGINYDAWWNFHHKLRIRHVQL